MKKNHITRFEEIVQGLVEGTFARLFAGRLRPLEVANALADAMEDDAVPGPGDLPQAPNHYRVALNPDDYRALLTQQPDLAASLAQHVFDLAQQVGFVLPNTPRVDLASQEDVPLHKVRVEARQLVADSDAAGEDVNNTRQMMALSADTHIPDDRAPVTRPFLIVEGQRHVELHDSTVSLGRSMENDIIVDDARVSRQHAQLRRRYNRYVIFDLGSTGGTTVNSYPVQECMLEAGDVISLAGVEIIYGEDTPTQTPPPRGTSGTPALHRPTLTGTDQLPPVSTGPSET